MNTLSFRGMRSSLARLRHALQLSFAKSRGCHSQYAQDRWIMRDIFADVKRGYFLDIGASDGETGSNTLLLERAGWTGLCIEPNPLFFALLQAKRGCATDDACLSDRERDVWLRTSDGIYGGITDEHREGDILKRAVTIATVLARHDVPPVIHYCSVDVEGSEEAVLSTFPFDRHTVLAFTIEHNFNERRRAAIRALLERRGYRYARSLGVDDCYLHESVCSRS